MTLRKQWAVCAAALFLPAALAGCVSDSDIMRKAAAATYAPASAPRYGAVSDGAYTIAAVPAGDLKARYMRQLVDDPTGQPAGTVVVDPKNRFLYLVQEGGKALRYGVGVGKAGMAWSGTANVAMKREWPRWTPTKDMIAREPDKCIKWARGMEGGTQNPLGARALYLFRDGKDTLYRIHGTNEPWSIGQPDRRAWSCRMSSACGSRASSVASMISGRKRAAD